MNRKRPDQRGFSLIELAMVIVIVFLIAAVAVPNLIGSRDAAEKTFVIASLRSIHTDQVAYHATRGRYGRLNEINDFSDKKYGKMSGTTLTRKEWIYLMSPTPTDATLRTRYQIIAYKIRSGRIVSAFVTNESGVLSTLIP